MREQQAAAFYRVLELEPGASLEEVKTAYRELTKVWHPDRFSGDEKLQQRAHKKLAEINEAYSFLDDYLRNQSGSTPGIHPDVQARRESQTQTAQDTTANTRKPKSNLVSFVQAAGLVLVVLFILSYIMTASSPNGAGSGSNISNSRSSKAGLLPYDELGKLEGTARIESTGWSTADIYNGTERKLDAVTIQLTAKDESGKELFQRKYRLTSTYGGQALSSSEFIGDTGYRPQQGHTWTWGIVSATWE